MSAPLNPTNGNGPRLTMGQFGVRTDGQASLRPNVLPPNVYSQDPTGVINEAVVNAMTARTEMFRRLFDPRRNLADECGWPSDEIGYGSFSISPDLYRMLYDRDPIATRVVQLMPEECWQKPPTVFEDEDPDTVTDFEEAWDNLGRQLYEGPSWYQDEVGSPVWAALKKADMLSGIGAFGIVLIGLADGKNLEDPVDGVVMRPTVNSDGTVTNYADAGDGRFRESESVLRFRPAWPDSYLADHEEKALLEPKPSRVWNGRYHQDGKAMFEDRKPVPLNDGEKAVLNRWRGEREYVLNTQREATLANARSEAILNAGKARTQSQWGGIGVGPGNPVSVPDSLRGGPGSENNPAQSFGMGFVPAMAPASSFTPPYVPASNPASPLFSGSTFSGPTQPAAGIKGQGLGGAASLGGAYTQGAGLGGVGGSAGGPYGPGGSLLGTDAQYFGVITGPTELPSDTPAVYPDKARPKITFLRVFDESLVQIVRYEWNVNNPRFGKPVMYRVTLNDPRVQHTGVGLPMATVFVHWSRVIHAADCGKSSSEIFAVPQMQPCLNTVLDIRKVRGASAEGYYKSAFQGLQFSTHPQLGGDVILDTASLKDQVENYWNGLQRVLMSAGGQWSTLAPSVVDPTPHIEAGISAICIVKGCPVRVFKGSERGELASSQDDEAWNERKAERQTNYLTPRLIVPFIDRLILMGVLPEPVGNVAAKKPKPKPLPKLPTPPGTGGSPLGGSGGFGGDGKSFGGKGAPTGNRRVVRYLHPDGRYRREFAGSVKDRWLAANIRSSDKGRRPVYNLADPTLEKSSTVVDAGGYSVEWPELDALGETQRVAIALQKTQAIQAYVAGQCESVFPARDWLTRVMNYDEEEADAIIESVRDASEADAPLTIPPSGEEGHPATVPPPPPTPVIMGGRQGPSPTRS